jgi:response regulator NasT
MAVGELTILIVDDDEERADALRHVLRGHGYRVAGCVSAVDYLPDRVREMNPDVILMDIDAPSRDTLERISLVNRELPRPIIMFSQDEDAATIRRAISAGVTTYLVDGLKATRVRPVIEVAIAHFREYQALREELERTKLSLSDRRIIDRAKGLLMARRNLSEPQAYALLRTLAMNHKRRIAEVAADIIELAEVTSHDATRP